MALTNTFSTYKILYYSAPHVQWHAIVMLYEGRSLVGRINFIRRGFDTPQNEEINGIKTIHFPEDKFDEVTNILRHEDPLYISLNTAAGVGMIHTTREPIGEEETT